MGKVYGLSLAFAIMLVLPCHYNKVNAQNILVTNATLYSLVTMITEDIDLVSLLWDANQSIHSFSPELSQLQKIENADIIFSFSRHMENYITNLVQDPNKSIVFMLDSADITLYRNNFGAIIWSKIQNMQPPLNYHFWLYPQNAIMILQAIRNHMITANPIYAKAYSENYKKYSTQLQAIDTKAKDTMSGIDFSKVLFFHDAWIYLIKPYNPNTKFLYIIEENVSDKHSNHNHNHLDHTLSPKHILEIKEYVESHDITCVFVEKQLREMSLEKVLEKIDVRIILLDPIGDINTAKSQDIYMNMLQYNIQQIYLCVNS